MTFKSGFFFKLMPVAVMPVQPLHPAVNALAETVNSFTTLAASERDGVIAPWAVFFKQSKF